MPKHPVDATVKWYSKLQWIRIAAAARMIVLFLFLVAVFTFNPQNQASFLAPYGFYMISAFSAGIQLANQWPRPSWHGDSEKGVDVKQLGLISSIGFISLAAFLTSLLVTTKIFIDMFHKAPEILPSLDPSHGWLVLMAVTGSVVTLLDCVCLFFYVASIQG